MTSRETLYSRNAKGKILSWIITATDNDIHATITVASGELKGKKVITSRVIISGKNIGRSNETSYWEQAITEVNSEWIDKRKKGYKTLGDLDIVDNHDGTFLNTKTGETISCDLATILDMYIPEEKSDPDGNLKPMKCQPYRRGKMKYPCFGQPKINGGRCVARLEPVKVTDLFSTEDTAWRLRCKEGDELIIPHIVKALKGLPNLPYDGEVYIQKIPVTTINGAARNSKNPVNKNLMLWIFDLSIPKVSQKDRFIKLDQIANDFVAPVAFVDKKGSTNHQWFSSFETPVVILDHVVLNSDEEAEDYREKCISAGFEGCVIRDMDATYKFGSRPITMMKLKNFIDAEFEVVDIIPQEKRPDLPVFVLRNDINSLTFESNPTGTHDFQKDILINKEKWIGKFVTVRYRERTIENLPFHTNVIF